MPRTMLLLSGLFWSLSANAQDAHLNRFVDKQTLAVGKLDLRRFEVPAFFQSLGRMVAPIAESMKSAEEKTAAIKDQLLKAGVTDIYFIYGAQELSRMPTLYAPVSDKNHAETVASLLATGQPGPFQGESSWISPRNDTSWKYHDGYVIVGQKKSVDAAELIKPVHRTELQAARALESAAGFSLYVIPSTDIRRVMDELVPTLPKELGGGSSTLVTKGLQWAALNVDFPPKLSCKLHIQAASPEYAVQLQKQWQAILSEMKKEVDRPIHVPESFKYFYQLMSSMKVTVVDRQLTLTTDGNRITELTALLSKSLSTRAGDELNTSNLRQICIAMHNFHNDWNRLPNQAILSKDDKPLLSWRVALLPYLGEDHLYKEFKTNEPWDSEHNKKLIEKMPKVYTHPFAKNVPANHTLYQVFYSKQGAKPAAAIMETGKMTLGMLTVQDGTSNTFVLTDAAAEAVPWTKPADLLFDGKVENLPKLVSPRGDGWAHVGFGDCHTQRFKPGGKPKLLWQLIGRNDGENNDATELFVDK
ncbi:MAG TPA: DUF1559 domain-containing protein [Gemmatales bacterium]|nr:DUF1559 domain-containing protein [Gemmatales bacterium]